MGVTVDGKTTERGAGSKNAGVKKTSVKRTMGKSDSGEKEVDPAPVFENPLVPHAVLREMYRKLVESRLLGERAVTLVKDKKLARILKATYGQEACRVSLTQGLSAGDMVMDAVPGRLIGHLLGADAKVLLDTLRLQKGKKPADTKLAEPTRLLPFVEDAETRLFAGLGVALLAKQMQRTDGIVIFVAQDEASRSVWRRVLTLTAKQQLPAIFMVLPNSGATKDSKSISGLAERCGVPGIPVDASDAVALYRVAQESLGRLRAGGGGVLIEGVSLPDPSKKKRVVVDPVAQLKNYLVQRRVAPEAWFAEQEKSFSRLLGPLRK